MPERVTDFSVTTLRISEHDYYEKLSAAQRQLLNAYSMPPGRMEGGQLRFDIASYRLLEIEQAANQTT